MRFLSPARRGRGILVTPVFCLVSRFLVGARTQKLLVIFLKCKHDSPRNMGLCKYFFKDATKIQNGRQNFYGWENSEIIQILLSHPPPYGDVHVFFSSCYKNSKWPPRINLNFFVGAKTLKRKVRNYSNFTITFPKIWRCAGDFYPSARWARRGIVVPFVRRRLRRRTHALFWLLHQHGATH